MINVYSVKFKNDVNTYYFKAEGFECPLNVTVIVESDRGKQFGKVISKVNNYDDISNLHSIIRISNKDDYRKYLDNLKYSEQALSKVNEIVESLNLPMHFLSADYTFDRKQLLFEFVADERIDFRDLLKKFASIFKTRIELKQIGARDKAKRIGGIGICGRQLCCTTYLTQLNSVGISMAKNQGLALNPNKINGICGRLLCCLAYEDEAYIKQHHGLPNVGDQYETIYGMGKVLSVDILNRKYKILINNEVKEIRLDEDESSKE